MVLDGYTPFEISITAAIGFLMILTWLMKEDDEWP